MPEDKPDKPGNGITNRYDPNFLQLAAYAELNKLDKGYALTGSCSERTMKAFGYGFSIGGFFGMAEAGMKHMRNYISYFTKPS